MTGFGRNDSKPSPKSSAQPIPQPEKDNKKEKVNMNTQKIFAIGITVIIAFSLIIALSVIFYHDIPETFIPSNPPPPGPRPYSSSHFNDYYVSNENNNSTSYSGNLSSFSQYFNGEVSLSFLQKVQTRFYQTEMSSLNPRDIPTGVNNLPINDMSYQFLILGYTRCSLQLTDAKNPRFSVPSTALNKPTANGNIRMEMIGLSVNQEPFSFMFTDIADANNVYVHTLNSTLVYMDKFIQMDFQLPSQRVYGLGERVRQFQLEQGTWTMWAKSQSSPIDDGSGGRQSFGVHPFLLAQSKKKGEFFGMFFRNSNAQSPFLNFNSDGTSTLSYITTGGQLEVYFFLRGSAQKMIQAYHSYLGKPTLPPFWALGWHQASQKYQSQDDISDVLAKYRAADMPLEAIWLDKSYMDNLQPFSVNSETFPSIQDLVNKEIHAHDQKIVLVIEAGISADNTSNPYYKSVQKNDLTIKSSINSQSQPNLSLFESFYNYMSSQTDSTEQETTVSYNGSIVMKTWSNQSVFIDWFNNEASSFWNEGLTDLYKLIPFDGLWLDMNEPTGKCSGECPNYNSPLQSDTQFKFQQSFLSKSELETLLQSLSEDNDYIVWYYSYPNQDKVSTYYLPFIPGFYYGGNLDNSTLSLNATNPSINETQYNLHSLYGLMESKATFEHLFDTYDKLPFVQSRSTFAGSGTVSSHGLTENWNNWAYMEYSIAGVMNMNMFGIPHSGADVCGFYGQALDDEMCARWIQLATFYPFARFNQNETWNGSQSESSEPYNLNSTWQETAKLAMYDRYQYLRQMYTCLYEVSQSGGTCFDPLFYYYPLDDNCFTNIESSFIVAGMLKVSPILSPSVSSYESYFPKGIWVNLNNFSQIIDSYPDGMNITLTSQTLVNTHLMEGKILVKQNNSALFNTTTALLTKIPLTMIANLDSNGYAYGTVFLNNDDSIQDLKENKYESYQLTFSAGSLKIFPAGGTSGAVKTINSQFDQLIITNALAQGLNNLNNTQTVCALSQDFLQVIPMQAFYNESEQALYIKPTEGLMNFSSINSIQIGKLCEEKSYQVENSSSIDLSKNYSEILLNHSQGDLPELKVTMQMMKGDIVNVQVNVSEQSVIKPERTQKPVDIGMTKSYSDSPLSDFVTINTDASYFSFQISQNNQTYYSFNSLLFLDYLVSFNCTLHTLPSPDFIGLWGIGERIRDFFYTDGVYSTFAFGPSSPIDDGKPPGDNMYGVHPIYFGKASSSLYFGVFNLNSNAADFWIKNDNQTGNISLQQMSTGGLIDLYFITGTTPYEVVQKYHQEIVGKPMLIPMWTLGWQQSRWGYKYLSDLKYVVDQYAQSDIPLEAMWSDIDYMDNYWDFKYDPDTYSNLPEYIQTMHQSHIKYIPILEAAIARRPYQGYDTYIDGVNSSAFLQIEGQNGTEQFFASVRMGDAVIVDFFKESAIEFWQRQLTEMYSSIEFDGLWEDVNEASIYCNGQCITTQINPHPVYAKMPYVPCSRILYTNSISLDAIHDNGYQEIDTHSLFGTKEAQATASWFKDTLNKRPFIMTRSTFAGHGKYGSHWLGDNYSSNYSMGASVIGIMNMNLFGISLVGSDICGFHDDTTPELCARWTVVGSFQPFSRNHNIYSAIDQEPYVFTSIYEDDITYKSIMKMAIRNKYHLIRYYYTEMFKVSQSGGTVYQPLFYQYPDDQNCYRDFELNVMIGSSFKLSVLSNLTGVNSTEFYFPEGTWCNVFNLSEPCFSSTGEYLELRSKAYDFYLHLRQGKIVPHQNATQLNINTTYDLQQHPIQLHIHPSLTTGQSILWTAQGDYVNDDGEVLDLAGNFNQYNFTVNNSKSQPQDFDLNVDLTERAINYMNESNQNCTAVNSNDYLDNIQVYNAQNLGLTQNYSVSVEYLNETSAMINKNATYQKYSQRVVLQLSDLLCLPSIKRISFRSI